MTNMAGIDRAAFALRVVIRSYLYLLARQEISTVIRIPGKMKMYSRTLVKVKVATWNLREAILLYMIISKREKEFFYLNRLAKRTSNIYPN